MASPLPPTSPSDHEEETNKVISPSTLHTTDENIMSDPSSSSPPLQKNASSASTVQFEKSPGESCPTRKRDYNRRKSDPIALKKIPKLEPESDSEEMNDFSDSIHNFQDFDSLPDDEDDDDQDDQDLGKDPDFRPRSKSSSSRSRRKPASKLGKVPPHIKNDGMFHFHWKNHQGHLLSAFESLLEHETFCDVTLICDGDTDEEIIVALKAHKIVLSACSDYFRNILQENPCKHPVIVLKDYAAWEVQTLLDFMYRGEVDVGMDKVENLVKSAKSLQIRGLTESLSEKLSSEEPQDPLAKSNNKIGNLNLGQTKIDDLLDSAVALNLTHSNRPAPKNDLPSLGGESIGSGSDEQEHDLLDPHDLKPTTQHLIIMPRRKQARPRRRSGDYIAQDLRKVCNKSPNDDDLDVDIDYTEEEEDGFDEDEEVEDFPGLGLPINMTNINKLLGRRLLSDPSLTEQPEGNANVSKEIAELEDLPQRRRSSRLHYHEGDRDHDRGQENVESEHIIDYTTHVAHTNTREKVTRRDHHHHGGSNSNNKKSGGLVPNHNDALHQQHLTFLRNYNWALAQRGKLTKLPDSDLDDRDRDSSHRSLTPNDRTPPPSKMRSPKQSQSFLRGPDQLSSFPFLPGLIPPVPNPSSPIGHLNQSNSNKGSPISPGSSLPPNCFLSSTAAMSITPLGEERTSSSSPYSPNPINHLGMDGESRSGGDHHHHLHGGGGGGSRGKYKERERGSPNHGGHPHWPGLPLGPPPIFGRHRAQHSAPRGGPPRAWSNADLTEALHNVWNKKMTTSQASRVFGIPYNSLLMYVRGKYGKSLKLDVLKKGLDQAMENSQLRSTGNGPTPPSINNSSPSSQSKSPNSNHHPSTPTPTQTPNTTSAVSALLQSLHNNNNTVKSSETNNNHTHTNNHKSSKFNGGGGVSNSGGEIPLPPEHNMPPGFNPFFFGDFGGNPFPFASALQHILPPHLMGAGVGVHHPHHINHNHNGPHPPGPTPQQPGGVMDGMD